MSVFWGFGKVFSGIFGKLFGKKFCAHARDFRGFGGRFGGFLSLFGAPFGLFGTLFKLFSKLFRLFSWLFSARIPAHLPHSSTSALFSLAFIFSLLPSIAFGAVGERLQWESGKTLLGFFEQNLIPLKLYYNLTSQDKELTAEVKANATYYTLRSEGGDLLHALIPVSDKVQIHIYKKGDDFKIDFIPIISFKKDQILAISLQSSPYQDIYNTTNDILLATEFANIYRRSISTRTLHVDDKIALIFTRSYRLGKPFGIPEIKATMVESAKKAHFGFLHTNGHYYDKNGKEMAGFALEVPVRYTRISSRFSAGRKHPILKVVRPHYGVDYAAKIGTPIIAAASGKVIFAGVRGGYGKVVEIAHGDGLKTLYAHMSAIHTRTGASVKVGTIIGRVGNTGVSTGPHLHFGVYKYNQPINPLGRIRTAKSELSGKEKKAFLEVATLYENELVGALDSANWQESKYVLITQGGGAQDQDDAQNEDEAESSQDEGANEGAIDEAESSEAGASSAESRGAKSSQSA
ncbi:hypothetical protein BKN38_01525 [Helicobacter sp. CLO-3]|uniref:peptidoglycan DD-metalloendopeptidase family protein n=1 Tax=unclassified Helicobacter TaxID=2593540 RepID=UPI0008057D2A|nr:MULTISPECIES: peptidoglycan DD-metalloendopeptidase family protein [unclassified Helicobacter]OBV29782.1 hypothetical protein BA723_00325 [Helicobacter sp. CLO-3]OHU85236.1 hypothetical protein BKN38_01525 [Helicobacter sp. CLO-3]